MRIWQLTDGTLAALFTLTLAPRTSQLRNAGDESYQRPSGLTLRRSLRLLTASR